MGPRVLYHFTGEPELRWRLRALRIANERTNSTAQVLIKFLLEPHLLTSHWPEQVTWLSRVKMGDTQSYMVGGMSAGKNTFVTPLRSITIIKIDSQKQLQALFKSYDSPCDMPSCLESVLKYPWPWIPENLATGSGILSHSLCEMQQLTDLRQVTNASNLKLRYCSQD